MNGRKLIGWAVGIAMVVGEMAATPAFAIPNYSDITGSNTNNQTDILYGFEPIVNLPVLNAALQEAIESVNSLLASGQEPTAGTAGQEASNTIRSFRNGVENDADSTAISPETRAALLALAEYLQEIEQGLWAYGNDLDSVIQASATGLKQDLAAANNDCQVNPSNCGKLNSLVTRTSNFVQKLKAFEARLQQQVQKARIY